MNYKGTNDDNAGDVHNNDDDNKLITIMVSAVSSVMMTTSVGIRVTFVVLKIIRT